MHIARDGARDAPPFLLIHGSGATSGTWKPVVTLLADHHQVIRVDLPGHGHSPPSGSYAVPAQAGVVAAMLDELDLSGVAVAGHSSGGFVATALAEERPDLVKSVALVSTGPSLDALLPEPFLLRALKSWPIGGLLWPLRTDAMSRRAILSTCAQPVDVPDDVIAELRSLTFRTFRTVLRQNGAYVAERTVPERLAVLDVPVLVIFGGAEPRYEPSSVHQYEIVPGARIEILPGVGHLPMFEAPETTAKLLASF
jgi:pimeloyl-ACP methyl ester carboxylesterase